MTGRPYLNRYVDHGGGSYRVCHLRNADGSPGRPLLIVRQLPRGEHKAALDLTGRRAAQILAQLAVQETVNAARPAGTAGPRLVQS